jgi:predicted acylesterase/phospholipase RssA
LSDALVLTGSALKGAFAAGVLSVLCDREVKARLGIDIRRIVGSSSGALNGAYFAASIRMGQEAIAGEGLVRVWVDDATLSNVFSPTLRGIFGLRGLFDTDGMLSVMRRRLVARPGTEHIDLRVVLTDAGGRPVGDPPMTTYEQVVSFSDEDFDTEPSLDRVRKVAAASASVPVLFVPARVDLDGRTFDALDGGLVDTTPLGAALGGSDVRRVFVVTPFPRVVPPPRLRGLALLAQLLDILTEERLTRDLRTAQKINRALHELAQIVPEEARRARLLDAVGWPGRRPVRIVEIRPEEPLPGHSFSGIFSQVLRESYVRAGVDAATRVLATIEPAPSGI